MRACPWSVLEYVYVLVCRTRNHAFVFIRRYLVPKLRRALLSKAGLLCCGAFLYGGSLAIPSLPFLSSQKRFGCLDHKHRVSSTAPAPARTRTITRIRIIRGDVKPFDVGEPGIVQVGGSDHAVLEVVRLQPHPNDLRVVRVCRVCM